MSEGEKTKQRGRKTGRVCPGLPSPSGVHLVTHPLHRAQYMTGWQRERGKRGEGERESACVCARWGIHKQVLTHT